jgi:uncharacterized membrane protein
MISQWASNQTVDAAHWLIGEGLMVEGKALRSMKDPSGMFTITRFGNFTADFKELPPPIPQEYLLPLYGIVATSIVGWSIPSIIGWIKKNADVKRLNYYHQRINSLYDDGTLDENDIEPVDKLRNDIIGAYAKGKINKEYYADLKNEISVIYEEIYNKKIDPLRIGKNRNGIVLEKVKEDIIDAYAKGKISEQHYKLLNEISDSKNNQQSSNNQLTSSSQSSVPTSTTQGSPIKS